MKLSEKLLVVANWLASDENDLLVSAEFDDDCLEIVASSLVKAATALEECATITSEIEPAFTNDALDEMAAIAAAFDESGDYMLIRQASVLDEILLTLAAPKGILVAAKKKDDDRIEQLKKKYKDIKSDLEDLNRTADVAKQIEKSPVYKQYRPLQEPLSTRVCPEHFSQLARVGENTWQCMLDKKTYNYDIGFTTEKGGIIPGTSVSEQTNMIDHQNEQAIFDTRNQRLGED